MKKLLLSLAICVGLASFVSQVSAQSTAIAPYDGATHTYTFDGIDDGREFEFFVTQTPDFSATRIPDFGTFTTSATGTVAGAGAAVTIQWATDASAVTKYATGVFVFVKIHETTAGTDICENYKAVKVIPVPNAFNILLADEVTSPSCPTLVNGFNPVVAPADTYNAGKTTLTYRVERTGSPNDWSFDFDISRTGTGNFTYTAGAAVTGDQTSTLTGIAVNTITTNFIDIVIVVDNMPGEKPTFTIDVTSAQDFVTKVSPLTYPTAVTHTINIMPTIGGFTGS